MKSVSETIQLSKDLFHKFLWRTKCPTLHPELPSEHVKGQHRIQSSQRQMANALGKSQFVVDAAIHSFLLSYVSTYGSLCL